MTAPPPPRRPIIKREGFIVKNGVITCNGYERVDNARLEKLFRPERHCHQRHQKRFTDEAATLFSRPFFASQLRFYGISFPKSATEAQLHSLLDKAVLAKQCVQVPASVTQLHQNLKLTYDTDVDAWEKTVDNWEMVWRQRREEAWAQLETPTERAGHDLDRFMEQYYLTDGQPDPAKKPEPLALYGITDDRVIAEIHRRAAQVPGLKIASAGSGPDRTFCVGWGRAAVCGLAGEIENVARGRQKRAIEAAWEKAMQFHQRFVDKSERPILAQSSAQVVPTSPALIMARGSFILQCKTVSENFPDHPKVTKLALDISDSAANNTDTLRAAVELGVFQGTAVLSFSQAVLDWFVRYYDKIPREATGRPLVTDTYGGAKRKSDIKAEGERPSKQRRTEESSLNRIHLRMRGRTSLDGQICADIQNGYLEFTDSAWTKFKGALDIPGIGGDIEVEGFRMAEKATIDPTPWNHYLPGLSQYSAHRHPS